VQDILDHPGQILRGEGLLEKGNPSTQEATSREIVVGVA
jgi:hypothetical protein